MSSFSIKTGNVGLVYTCHAFEPENRFRTKSGSISKHVDRGCWKGFNEALIQAISVSGGM